MARSLAATWAITSVFFSCGYLDVSVPRVPFRTSTDDRSLHLPGCPIRKSMDHCALAAPHRVSPLGTSFIGTLPLGIPQKPCLTLNTRPLHTHSLPPPRRPKDQTGKRKPRTRDGQPSITPYRAAKRGSKKTYGRRCFSPLQTVKKTIVAQTPDNSKRLHIDVCTLLYSVVKVRRLGFGRILSARGRMPCFQDAYAAGASPIDASAWKYTASETVCQGNESK